MGIFPNVVKIRYGCSGCHICYGLVQNGRLSMGSFLPYYYKLPNRIIMKRRQAILDLDSSLSRLLDTLCLELSITSTDASSAGLVEILEWRLDESVSQQQFSQLYAAWVEAKGITDLLSTRQQSAYDKSVLLQTFPTSLLTHSKLTTAIDLLNAEYIQQVGDRDPQTEVLERIFNGLDEEGVGHLRRSQLVTLFEGMIEVKVVRMEERSVEYFMGQIGVMEKQVGGVEGRVSFRNFNNGMIRRQLPTKTLRELEQYLNSLKRPLTNLFQSSLSKWKTTPRFHKKRIDRYKRIFQQHDYLFFTSPLDPYTIQAQLQGFYGKSFLMVADIDFVVIREFCDILRAQLEGKIKEIMVNVDRRKRFSLENMETPTPKSTKSVNKLSARQPIVKKTSNQQQQMTTPKKLSSTMNVTPKKNIPTYEFTQIRSIRQTTSTMSKQLPDQRSNNHRRTLSKSPLPNRTSKSKSPRLHTQQSQAPPQVVQKLNFFKNRRVESFQIVMKRLRMRK